jgi:hypothetical protein
VDYCQAIPGVSGTVAQVGKMGSECDRSLFDDGGSGAVCDRSLVRMNRHRSEKPVSQSILFIFEVKVYED